MIKNKNHGQKYLMKCWDLCMISIVLILKIEQQQEYSSILDRNLD